MSCPRVFLGGATLSDVAPLIGVLAVVVLARALLGSLGESLAQRAATRTSAQLRAQLLAHVVRLGPVWLSGERRGQIATLATRGIDSVEPLSLALPAAADDRGRRPNHRRVRDPDPGPAFAAVIVGVTAPLVRCS